MCREKVLVSMSTAHNLLHRHQRVALRDRHSTDDQYGRSREQGCHQAHCRQKPAPQPTLARLCSCMRLASVELCHHTSPNNLGQRGREHPQPAFQLLHDRSRRTSAGQDLKLICMARHPRKVLLHPRDVLGTHQNRTLIHQIAISSTEAFVQKRHPAFEGRPGVGQPEGTRCAGEALLEGDTEARNGRLEFPAELIWTHG
mmetsp:Transcript_97995/g.281905  ORF Transcript_97995/g.281905 Transcript_97995/m.281905 type:complete len:200 (-) Transcript_97995:886-1485(-)